MTSTSMTTNNDQIEDDFKEIPLLSSDPIHDDIVVSTQDDLSENITINGEKVLSLGDGELSPSSNEDRFASEFFGRFY
jgi:hypothetical protein